MPLPIIVGEFGLVADPEAKFSGKGNLWAKVRVVAKDRKRDQNGEWTDGDPLFLDLVAFGRYAENLVESCFKGDTVTVTGKLSMSEWQTDAGEKRVSYQITAETIGVSLKWNPVDKRDRDATAKAVSNLANAGMTEDSEPPF